MMRTVTLALVVLIALSPVVAAAPRLFLKPEVTWTPEQPEPGDRITVYATPEGNVTSMVLQVCVDTDDNYICRIPQAMEKTDDLFSLSFYINETAHVHLNFSLTYGDGSQVYDNTTSFRVEPSEGGNGGDGMPGFALAGVLAAGAGALMARRRRTKG
ncbi:MAG TPA: LPXTG cell wall anchor domain-containing protein [Thermoplasmatales archaeon]|nr:LPXTG cell wall anchor domain-containing protein [Thermoplasmatales archaeon]